MRTWVIQNHGSIDGLERVDWPEPELAAEHVLVAVRAVSLNYRDLGTVRQARPGNLPPPLIPCSDGAGEIVAVGSGVTRFQVGDRVMGTFFRDWMDGPFSMEYHKASRGGSLHGMLCEYVAVEEHSAVPIPGHLSYAEASTLCRSHRVVGSFFSRPSKSG
jgi:NADPH:quinone reductase-like Zn-dependent oxidoreductase